MNESDVQLGDHELKCRCCFRVLIEGQKMVKINESIEQNFFELTQVKLVMNSIYSETICELCDRDLRNFHNLRKDLSMKQQRLYELLPAIESTLEPAVDQFIKESFTVVEASENTVPDKSTEDFEKPKAKVRKKKQDLRSFQTNNEQIKEENELNLFCSECEIFLSTKTSFKRHVDRVHLKIKNFFCDRCSYASFFKHSLEKHVIKHIPEEYRDRYSCELCSFVSISSVNIVLHHKYEHNEPKTSFVCNFDGCKKSFSQPDRVRAHYRLTHEKRKEKICATCSRAFSTSTRLKEHVMSTHTTPVKNFTCEFCVKQFVTLRQLKSHQVYHGEPQYTCQMGCNKKFYKTVRLEGHHKSHLKLKDFICPYDDCESTYFMKSHLKRHINSVHEKVKFTCEICRSKFGRKENYRSHILLSHQEISNSQVDWMMKKAKLSKT